MDATGRRSLLISKMQELQAQGIGCNGCSGTCCTYQANSMMVTPLETRDLLQYLSSQQMLTPELKDKCQKTVEQYRLDSQLGNGRRSLIRRTYTCPFFGHQQLGCPLPVEVKPYGCLAFNSHHPEHKADTNCFSEVESLKARESQFPEEDSVQAQLKIEWQLDWDKLPLPVALLLLWDRTL